MSFASVSLSMMRYRTQKKNNLITNYKDTTDEKKYIILKIRNNELYNKYEKFQKNIFSVDVIINTKFKCYKQENMRLKKDNEYLEKELETFRKDKQYFI